MAAYPKNSGRFFGSVFRSATLMIAMQPVVAQAALTALDDFDYVTVGSDLNGKSGGGSFGFMNAWTGQTSFNIGNGSLASPVAALPVVGNSVTAVAFGDNRGIDRNLSTQLGVEGTSAYVSVLMQPQGILGQGAYNGWFAFVLRGSTNVGVGMSSFSSAYGLEVGFESSLTTTNAVIGKSVFFVLRFDFTEGVDPVYLFVNPPPGEPEPASPSASLINLNVNFLNMVSLAGPGGSAFDALRIGTTYADVTPPSADFDGDKDVDADDLARWQSNYSTGATQSLGNADADSDVDGADFLLWQRQVGFPHAATTAVTSAVPEPTTSGMLAVLLGVAFRSLVRRR